MLAFKIAKHSQICRNRCIFMLMIYTWVAGIYACMFLWIYVFMYVCMFVCMYVCMHICIRTRRLEVFQVGYHNKKDVRVVITEELPLQEGVERYHWQQVGRDVSSDVLRCVWSLFPTIGPSARRAPQIHVFLPVSTHLEKPFKCTRLWLV